MRSPFPGMDPYLERHWRDVHHRLCTYACDALQSQVRPALLARLEERLVVAADTGESRSIYPDVKVIERTGGYDAGTSTRDAGVAVAEPVVLLVSEEPAYEGFIEIIDPTSGGRLVTVIEFLSLSNKLPGDGQRLYRAKRQELHNADVSLVEIDLLRTGDWVIQAPLREKVRSLPSHYRACARRGWKGGEYEYYPLHINEPLPAIRIPLRETDKDAVLNLQALIGQVYVNGAYDTIDYRRPPDPPLDGSAAEWADGVLRKAGKR